MKDLIERQAAIDAIVKWAEDNNENPDGDDCIMIILELPSAQPDCIECLRKIDDYGEEHYIGDNDKMFWDIRSILENPKHSEANHYGESTEIVRGKENR